LALLAKHVLPIPNGVYDMQQQFHGQHH